MRCIALATCSVLVATFVSHAARADDELTLAAAIPAPMVLVASAGGGGGRVARAPSGVFFGADGNVALMMGVPADPTRAAAAFDVRFGYAFRWGLSLQARFDDLGVSAPDPNRAGPLMLGSFGVRYSFPLVVMPFVEAQLGPVFDSSRASIASLLGVGLSLPILRHVLIDLAAHDVIADVDGDVRHVLLLGLGLTVGFSH